MADETQSNQNIQAIGNNFAVGSVIVSGIGSPATKDTEDAIN